MLIDGQSINVRVPSRRMPSLISWTRCLPLMTGPRHSWMPTGRPLVSERVRTASPGWHETGGPLTQGKLMVWCGVMLAAGCAWDGGSVLATLTSNYQLACWEPPRSRQDLCWLQFESISSLLFTHIKTTVFGKDKSKVVWGGCQ